jgi:AmmeMemoRadiSam system protein B
MITTMAVFAIILLLVLWGTNHKGDSLKKTKLLVSNKVILSDFSNPIEDEIDEIKYAKSDEQQINKILKWNESNEVLSSGFEKLVTQKKQIGLIVPHHLLAAQAMYDAYESIKTFDPELIIILTPNHQKKITAPIVVRSKALVAMEELYEMYSGIKDLEKLNLVRYDEKMFLNEHGFYNHLPFLKAFDFHSPLLPLAVARNASAQQLDELLAYLEVGLAGRRVLWIASIDFSHYLPAAVASGKDAQTMKWIETKDYESIGSSTSQHMDAPGVLRLWLMKFKSVNQMWHSNSAEITNSNYDVPGTSYFIYYGE